MYLIFLGTVKYIFQICQVPVFFELGLEMGCFFMFRQLVYVLGANLSPTIVLLQNSTVSRRVQNCSYFLVFKNARAIDA